RNRLLVLLTDGEVGNESEIVDRVLAASAGIRCVTFGIGTNVNDQLVGDLARRTGGRAEYVHPGERIDDKVAAAVARASAARVEDIRLRFEDVEATELASLPDGKPLPLVDGEPWVLYGRYGQPGYGRVAISGKLRGEGFYLEVPIEMPRSAERPALAAL